MKNKNKTSPTSTRAVTALSAMLALSVCPTQAFQPSFLAPRTRLKHHSLSSGTLRPAALTMDAGPWYANSNIPQRQPQGQHPFHSALVFSPPDWYTDVNFQRQKQLQVGDTAITEDTDDHYTLSLALPPDVDQDGLQVSVSGRLLTVKARITREEDFIPLGSRSGWVTRSSATETVSRSFVLPEGILPSSASTSFGADGKVKVKFNKDKAAIDETKPAIDETKAAVDETKATATAPVAPPIGDATKTSAQKQTATAAYAASSGSTDSSSKTSSATDAAGTTSDSSASAGSAYSTVCSSTDAAQGGGTARHPSSTMSVFEAMDRDFREFAKALWGQEVPPGLRFPTEEEEAHQAAAAQEARAKREAEIVERAKLAKEARANRVTAMRRATMAADLTRSDDGSSYVVKFALPEGTTRENVALTVSPDPSLRVSVSTAAAHGSLGRSVHRDVPLPKDANLSSVSAKFVEEDQKSDGNSGKGADAEHFTSGGAYAKKSRLISGVEVSVDKVIPPQPKSIDIM